MGFDLKLTLNILSVLCISIAFSQASRFAAGAAAKAQGEAMVAATGITSFFYNPAGTNMNVPLSVMVGYQNQYDLKAFQSLSFATLWPLQQFAIGLGMYRFGDEVYNNQFVKVTLAHKIQQIRLGFGAGIAQQYIETIGSIRRSVLEFGGLTSVTSTLSIGAHIFNFAPIKSSSSFFLPTILRIGSRLDFSDELMWLTEIEGIPDEEFVFRTGIQYNPISFLKLRAGFHTLPIQFTGGFGIHLPILSMDYAFSEHPILGSQHEITLILARKGE